MTSVALVALLLSSDPEPQRLLDDASLAVAAARCVEISNKLLAGIPEARSKSLRPRAEALAADARTDQSRISRGGPFSPLDESTILFNYGELCKLATEVFGYEKFAFAPNPNKETFVEDTTRIGFTKINRQSFAQTLQNPDEIAVAAAKTNELYKQLEATSQRNTLRSARWKRDMAKLKKELAQAEYDLKEPGKSSKVSAEAIIYAAHARAVGMLSAAGR
ncbi:MAG: hypothetical protein U0746_14960 [Gemmataceae bacterium]